jgi:glycosyltransferase involved in cell wall biosynthesis
METKKSGKPTMAFVDHSFHQKTKSGNFLRELFADNFIITDYWDDYWKNGRRVAIEDLNKHDYVFYFQAINPVKELKKIKAKIIWAPMYDGIDNNDFYWKNLSQIPLKVISFSEKISHYCDKFKISNIKIKYFKNPADYNYRLPEQGRHLFFWRRGNITFNDLKKIIIPEQIDSLTIFSNPDPGFGQENISVEDMNKFKVKMIKKNFISANDYFDIVKNSNIFISPRKKEGIGMSFLEALAMGMCVIANNEATMNEYIKDGENGYLFDLHKEKKIDLSRWQEVQKNSRQAAAEGHEQWRKEKLKIIDFILADCADKKINGLFFAFDCGRLFLLANLQKTIIKIKKIIQSSFHENPQY